MALCEISERREEHEEKKCPSVCDYWEFFTEEEREGREDENKDEWEKEIRIRPSNGSGVGIEDREVGRPHELAQGEDGGLGANEDFLREELRIPVFPSECDDAEDDAEEEVWKERSENPNPAPPREEPINEENDQWERRDGDFCEETEEEGEDAEEVPLVMVRKNFSQGDALHPLQISTHTEQEEEP